MDDAVALLELLGSDRGSELLAVSTVGFEPGLRAQAVAKLIAGSGARRDVRVFAGSHDPISRTVGGLFLPAVPYCDFMLRADHAPWPYNTSDVVSGLIDVIEAEPLRSVDVVLIGPVTNYARLVEARPSIVHHFRSVSIQAGYPFPNVTMCGRLMPNWFGQYNLNADVPASLSLLKALAPLARARKLAVQMVGADVTTRCWFETPEYNAVVAAARTSPALHALSDGLFFFHREYMVHRCPAADPYVFLHDPLTVAAMLQLSSSMAETGLTMEPTKFVIGVDENNVFRTWPVEAAGSPRQFSAPNFTLPLLFSTAVDVGTAKQFVLANVLNNQTRKFI